MKQLSRDYSWITLDDDHEFERILKRLETHAEEHGYQDIVDSVSKAQALEKDGRVDEAMEVFESLVARGVETQAPYKRLAINHRKRRSSDDELRILRLAIANIPERNVSHRSWFVDRLAKLEEKLAKRKSP